MSLAFSNKSILHLNQSIIRASWFPVYFPVSAHNNCSASGGASSYWSIILMFLGAKFTATFVQNRVCRNLLASKLYFRILLLNISRWKIYKQIFITHEMECSVQFNHRYRLSKILYTRSYIVYLLPANLFFIIFFCKRQFGCIIQRTK